MASSGIRRKVDDLGRVVIPAEIRRSLGIREGDAVEVTVDGERVVIARPRDACVFCGRDEVLRGFRGRLVCADCVGGIIEVAASTPDEEVSPSAPAGGAPRPPPAARPRQLGLPDGPIDGDAMALETAARQAAAREAVAGPVAAREAVAGPVAAREEAQPGRRRPPPDPASTTSW